MGRTQVTGTEILDNSVKGIDIDELTLVASSIPFSDSEFTANNIRDAIVESIINRPHKNFFYGDIDRDILIPSSRAMVMVNPKFNDNEIVVEGELVIL